MIATRTADRRSDRTIGIILITGFIMLIVGALAAPSGAYSGPIEDRLAVIDAHQNQWLLSKVFDGLAVVGASAGLMMLTIRRSHPTGSRLNTMAGFLAGASGAIGLTYIYMLATDPGPLYDRSTPAPIVTLFVALTATTLIAFGIDFLRTRCSKPIGLTSVTVGAIVLIAQVVIQVLQPGPEAAFGFASLMYIAILAIGVTKLRRSRSGKRTNARR